MDIENKFLTGLQGQLRCRPRRTACYTTGHHRSVRLEKVSSHARRGTGPDSSDPRFPRAYMLLDISSATVNSGRSNILSRYRFPDRRSQADSLFSPQATFPSVNRTFYTCPVIQISLGLGNQALSSESSNYEMGLETPA